MFLKINIWLFIACFINMAADNFENIELALMFHCLIFMGVCIGYFAKYMEYNTGEKNEK